MRFSDIRHIICGPENAGHVYIACAKGVYKSADSGLNWQLLSDYGLLERDIKFILISPDSVLYAATKSGVFRYLGARWHELPSGLISGGIRQIKLDNRGNLYAACRQGLFRLSAETPAGKINNSSVEMYFKDEPQINKVQEAAIGYADAASEKIKEWRKKAKMKAILPKLTVGLDNSSNSNYEIYTSATTHYVYEGPDDRSKGWDLTLSWDLSDLIWNSDQTSIDARSRLMVQLRDDVLDEVTKLYFERIRVKIELDNLSIEDRKKRFEKELKLQELTARLDGLTGGYFSQALKSKSGS